MKNLVLPRPRRIRQAVRLARLSRWFRRRPQDDGVTHGRDPLTGVVDCDHFHQELARRIKRRGRRKRIGVLQIDVSGLKRINEGLGSSTGDELLCDVSERLRSAVRQEDLVGRGRYGDFLVLAARVYRAEDAQGLAKRLLGKLRQTPTGQTGIPAEACVGIATCPRDGTNADQLVECARAALLQAKWHGPGSVRFFSALADREIRNQQSRLKSFRYALEHGQLTLDYQPQIDLATGRVVGVEALLRWNHPSEGILSPGEFLPAVEHAGLMPATDAWVLDHACRDLARWRSQGISLSLAVNVSAQSVKEPLVDVVASAIRRHGIPASSLEIELTETALMNSETTGAARSLERIAEHGVRLSIDDFGTGYASLSYLHLFPIEAIKIDRRFVQAAPHSRKDMAIIQAVRGLCRSLGIRVIAEGIETPEQMRLLQDLGCDICQGFLFGKPMPPEEVPRIAGSAAAAS